MNTREDQTMIVEDEQTCQGMVALGLVDEGGHYGSSRRRPGHFDIYMLKPIDGVLRGVMIPRSINSISALLEPGVVTTATSYTLREFTERLEAILSQRAAPGDGSATPWRRATFTRGRGRAARP